MYGKFLPSKKCVNRIILKSLLGVCAGGVLFSLFSLIYIAVVFSFVDKGSARFSFYELFAGAGMIVVGVFSWTLAFASVPTALGSVLLSAIVFRDFKLGNTEKSRTVKTGVLTAGFVGLS